jgi:Mce-associated membrane protein
VTATQRRTATALAGLVVVAVAVLGWLLRDQGDAGAAVTTAESSEASIASSEVGATVRDAAAKAASTAYSYSWDTLGDDRAAARALMTREMQRRYDRTMAGVGTSSRREHTVATAEVVDTALVTASTSYARVLVFVNQSTAGDNLEKPTLDLDRVLVTLRRVDGDWLIDELDAL